MKKILVLGLSFLVFPLFSAQAAVNSLNGLTGATQTFVNDTNVKITSTGTTHTLGWTGLLQAARGGTGAGTFTLNGVILGNTTGALKVTTAGTDGQLFLGATSAAPNFATLSGDATITNTGVLTIASNAVALGADTTGNYVATITHGSGISGSSALEAGTPILSLGILTSDWMQSGGFNIVLNNSSSNLKILENDATPSFYGIFDVGDLSVSDKTYTFPNATGTVVTTGNISDISGLTDSQISDTLTASTFVGTGSTSNAVDLSTAEVSGILGSGNGGTGNAFSSFSGPASTTKTFTLPNASAAILTDANLVTDAQISDTLTASKFVGTASTSDAVDLATTEVSGILSDANISNALTIDNTGSVDWAALSNYPVSATCAAGSAVTQIADAITCSSISTASNFVGSGSASNAVDLATAEVAGILATTKGGTGSSTTMTPNSIVFAGASGVYSEDNTDFNYNPGFNDLHVGGIIDALTMIVSDNLDIGGNAGGRLTWSGDTLNIAPAFGGGALALSSDRFYLSVSGGGISAGTSGINITAPTFGNDNGTNLVLGGGFAGSSTVNGGDVQIRGGGAINGGYNGNGGNVQISGGDSAGGVAGSVTLTGNSLNFQTTKANFTGNTSATVYIGNYSPAIPGCIALGDDDGGGITYITTHRGVLSASTTKPSNCQ